VTLSTTENIEGNGSPQPVAVAAAGSAQMAEQARLVQSGMNAARPSAARGGYLPIPLDQVLVRALVGMPIYLATGSEEANRFTLYCAKDARFTEFHKRRLQEAAVRMIYLPVDCHARFRRQVEKELTTIVGDATLPAGTRAALVYQTSLELVDDILAERSVTAGLPRIAHVAEAVAKLVQLEPRGFSNLFAHAQHDFYTATHMVNVGLWMTCLAHAAGVTAAGELQAACTAGMLHDIGKLFIPEVLLNKTEAVSEADWEELRSHAARGHEHLKAAAIKEEAVLRVCLEHHERLDGSGYPHALPGDKLHSLSRIAAVVDSFDAMTACRPFKSRVKTIAEAVATLQAEAPAKYDPKLVETWVKLLKKAAADGAFRESVDGDSGTGTTGRRKDKRHAIDCPAQVRMLTRSGAGSWSEGPAQTAKAHNMSKQGLGLLAKQAIPIGSYLRAVLKGKGTLQDRTVEGQVVRVRAYGDGFHEIGVRLCTPGEQERAASKLTQAA